MQHVQIIIARVVTSCGRKTLITIVSLVVLLSSSYAALEVQVRPDKIWVKPGQPVVLAVAVEGTDAPTKVNCQIRTGINDLSAEYSGITDAKGDLHFTFTPQAEWGYAAHIKVSNGVTTAESQTVFTCAANPYFVLPAYGFAKPAARFDVMPDGSAAPEGDVQNDVARRRIAEEVAFCRRFRSPVAEMMGPAHCSFSAIKPTVRDYFKGKHYRYSSNVVRGMIDALHENGVASVIYVNACLSSLPGYEFARQHPEYLCYTADGTVFGGLNTKTVEAHLNYERNYPASFKRAMNDREFFKQLTSEYPGCLNILMDFRDVRLAEIAARKIIEGKKYFGFDGVRYDGLYQVPSIGDPLAPSRDFRNYRGEKQPVGQEGMRLSVRNIDRAFSMLREHDPDILIGMNFAGFRPNLNGEAFLDTPFAKAISPGIWILDEVTKHANLPTHPDYKWEAFIRNMAGQADNVHAVGNVVFGGWGGGPGKSLVDTLQVASISWACGIVRIPGGYRPTRPDQVHPYTDAYAERCHFVARYSQFILNPALARLTETELDAQIKVEASRPVWWQPLVYRLTGADGRRYLVMNLINSPIEPHITETPQKPPVAETVQVTLSAELANGIDRKSVTVISADARPWQNTLALADTTDGGLILTVPAIEYWALILIPYQE